MPVDLNDFHHRETTRYGKPVRLKLYRHTCNNCGSDRGYQAKSKDDQGFKDSWKLENLQPLWYWDNRSKGAK